MNADLERWYARLEKDQRQLAMKLRAIIIGQGANLREELKWNQPCFYGKSMVCYIQKAKRHMTLGFGSGTELSDPEGFLQGSGKQMRHVKLPLAVHINNVALGRLVTNAIQIDGRQ
ncbi:DUF1801 domain-containing protein [Yoonia sp. R2-816]|uniref:DUF1801 domain-containing protein n=1 Tax=Yoonia sp. R2-816 TaxID=3342638 RepID=UPI0037263780